MSNRLSQLRNSRSSATSVFAQIIQLKNKYSQPLYCCFEGEDYKYYGIRVEQGITNTYEKVLPLKCGGKKEVIRLHKLINNEESLKDKKILYFIDLDFDKSIQPGVNEIYETPFYSIENFYTSQSVFERILVTELKIEETNQLYNTIVQTFLERQKEFHSEIALFNSWIYCQRQKESEDNKLNLKNFKLNKLIDNFSLSKIEFISYNKELLKSFFPNSVDITDDEITVAKTELLKKPQEKFRGKYEIEFLYLFLSKLVSEMNLKVAPFEGCTRIRLNISKVNILSELSQYAFTPNCLKEYLKKSA